MGKHHLWRKNSYVRVEKKEPGCIWAVFRILNYQRWNNVRKMLAYNKKEKPSKNKEKPDDEFQISNPFVLQGYDSLMLNSASVNSNEIKDLSTLLKEEDKLKETDLGDEKPTLEDDPADLMNTPTLVSLIKDDPKLDSPRKIGLMRSGTYPSPNNKHILGFGKTPSKIENKVAEIWPVMSNGNELRKAKSLRIRRSSSLNETLEKFGDFLDVKTRKEIKKFPSLSEQEFSSLGDHSLLRKSFKERLSLLETENHGFGANEAPRISFEMLNYIRGSRLDSPRDFDSPKWREKLVLDDRKENNQEREGGEDNINEDSSESVRVIGEGVQVQEAEQVNAEDPPQEDSLIESQTTSTLEYVENTQIPNDHQSMLIEEVIIEAHMEELEYVKHVLDVLGFVGGEDPHVAWESIDETLDPTLFDEIEFLCPFKPLTTKDSITLSYSHRRVLFHLIIEALVEIHEKSFAYHSPNSQSFWLQIGAMTKGGDRVVKDVWEFVNKCLDTKPELEPKLLDVLVSRDLSKSSNLWKSNQSEIEFIGLDLEELIFGELLEEILVGDC